MCISYPKKKKHMNFKLSNMYHALLRLVTDVVYHSR